MHPWKEPNLGWSVSCFLYILIFKLLIYLEEFYIIVYERYWFLVFLFGVMLPSWNKVVLPLLCYLDEIIENWCKFFHKCLVEFITESIWAAAFSGEELINYWFNFFHGEKPTTIVCFWLCEFWKTVSFESWSISSMYQICEHRVAYIVLVLYY